MSAFGALALRVDFTSSGSQSEPPSPKGKAYTEGRAEGRVPLGMRQPQSGSFRAILRYQKRESTKESRFFCLVLRKNLSLCGAKQF